MSEGTGFKPPFGTPFKPFKPIYTSAFKENYNTHIIYKDNGNIHINKGMDG